MTDESKTGPAWRRRRWLSWIGIVLLAWLLWHLGPEKIAAVISGTDLWLFVAATALYFPTIVLRIWRWQILLRALGVSYGFVPAGQGYLIGILIGLATPGRVGELTRAVFLKHDCGVPLVRGMPMVLVDRLFDFLVVLPFGVLALVSFGPADAGSAWTAVAGLVAVMALGLGLILHKPSVDRLRLLVARILPGARIGLKVAELLAETNRGFRQIRPAIFVLALSATVAAFALFYLECFIIAKSLGMEATPLATTYAISLGTLVAMVPLSISGIGTRDGAIVAYLGLHGVPSPVAIGFSLLWFVAFYGMSAILGTIAWGARNFTSPRL
jgi:hypothetical protein